MKTKNLGAHPERSDLTRFQRMFGVGRTAVRHILTMIIAAFLVYIFGMVHGDWVDMHRWNRATADVSLVLLTATMALGPGVRLWPKLRTLLPFRRELGIYSVILALVHTVIILDGWLEWTIPRLTGLSFHPALGRYVMAEHGFGLANLIGVLALAYGFVLMITSNDRSVRLLSGPTWKFLQSGAYVLWALVVVHTSYFLFMHFLHFHRPLPEPNALRWPFVVVVLTIVGLRWIAITQTWLKNGKKFNASPAMPSVSTKP